VNLYERWILPRLLDLAMRNKEVTRFRTRLVPEARGATLEVGIGSGLNLPSYGKEVARLHAVEPSDPVLDRVPFIRGRQAVRNGYLPACSGTEQRFQYHRYANNAAQQCKAIFATMLTLVM